MDSRRSGWDMMNESSHNLVVSHQVKITMLSTQKQIGLYIFLWHLRINYGTWLISKLVDDVVSVECDERAYQTFWCNSESKTLLDINWIFLGFQEQRSLKTSEMSQQDIHNRSAASLRLQGENFSSEKKAMSSQQQRQTVTASSVYNHEKQSSSQSNFTITTKGVSTKSSSMSSQVSSQLMTSPTVNY